MEVERGFGGGEGAVGVSDGGGDAKVARETNRLLRLI